MHNAHLVKLRVRLLIPVDRILQIYVLTSRVADKSNYWTPQLYYQHKNGSFEEVPHSGSVVYYLGRGDNRSSVQPFPPGFRMLSGDANARSYNNVSLTFGGTAGVTYVGGTNITDDTMTGGHWVNGTNGTSTPQKPQYFGRPIADRVSFNCLAAFPMPETPYMNDTDCENGLRAQIHFQSCWDGVNLYKSDNSHVAYMSDMDNGVCPPGYPVQLVHLFLETLYGVNNVVKDGGQFVWAQGDTTGYGFHGDFLNGWDTTVQTEAVLNCANPDNLGQISACPALAAVDTAEYNENCREQPPVINEPVHGMLAKLPGCITITSGPDEATSADSTCPANATIPSLNPTPVYNGPYTTFYPTVGKVYNNWTYLGCANETANGRSLTGASYTNLTSMTNEVCQAYCSSQNYPLAATEYGSQCYCGYSLDATTSLGQDCSAMTCSGNFTELCGGAARLNVWNSTTYSGPRVALYSPPHINYPDKVGITFGSSIYLGCASDNNTAGRTLNLASTTNNSGMTLDRCQSFCAAKNLPLWGTEYSTECYCGQTLPTNLAISTLNTTCSMPCSGNSSQTCGSPSLLTLFNNTAIAPPPPTPTPGTIVGTNIYLGCASEATSGRALNASTYTNTTVTNDQCASFCAAQNYALFGTEYSTQCFCSNALAAGATYPYKTGCSMACAGTLKASSPFAAYANTCGGSNRLSLWSNTLYKPVQNPATIGTFQSKGCYVEGTTGRALTNASITSTTGMTAESCVSYCSKKGYPLAGLENGDECYCGDKLRNGGKLANDAPSRCNMRCSGNKYEYCGGLSRLNVYHNSA